MNRVEISGRVTRDPEVRFVGDRRYPIAGLNVAVDDASGRFNRETKKTEIESGFYQVEIVGKYGEYIGSSVKKGDEVYVVGSLTQFRTQPKDGGEGQTKTRIKAILVNVLGGVPASTGIEPPADPLVDDDPWSTEAPGQWGP